MIRYGDNVYVTSDSEFSFIGKEVGTVVGESYDKVKVSFPLHKCEHRLDGCYWISREDLYIVDESPSTWFVHKVIFNGPATIVLWKDDTKTVAMCSENDVYDPYIGFCVAFTKKYLGGTTNLINMVDSKKK